MLENKSSVLDDSDIEKNSKLILLSIILFFVFIVYFIRLYSMQISQGTVYLNQSEKISRNETVIAAQRGEIFDRNANNPLVINVDSFAVEMNPGEIPAGYYDTVSSKLASFLEISKEEIDKKVPEKIRNQFINIELKSNVSFSKISNIAENITELPGISWKNKPIRNYVETGSISHILGYVGNITDDEFKQNYNKGRYNKNSVVGKQGIEKYYDEYLQGENGRDYRTVDAHGKVLANQIKIEPPESGKNLVLTIDTSIQRLTEKALGERVGAAIVLKPASGEILSMVSYPYFDPNIFSSDDAANAYAPLEKNEFKPMWNRAVRSAYPPASTFKTVMTAAILNENVVSPVKKMECKGFLLHGGRTFNCHKKDPGHGWLDLKNGLAQSCDVYYWLVGRDYLGVEKIVSYAQEFGFGQALNIDIDLENKGFVPDPMWKERKYHEKWLDGDTMNISIGQGYMTATPLHVANMMAMVCNSGKIYKPHFLKEIKDPTNNEVIKEYKNEVLHKSNIPESVWKQVQEDLRYTITDGTAIYPMNNKSVKIAGKTGTAEVNGVEKNHWHSWMVAYAPYDAPPEEQVVVVTLVEAVNDWEWWAPYATNIIIQGIFNDQTFDEAIDTLGFRYLVKQEGRQE